MQQQGQHSPHPPCWFDVHFLWTINREGIGPIAPLHLSAIQLQTVLTKRTFAKGDLPISAAVLLQLTWSGMSNGSLSSDTGYTKEKVEYNWASRHGGHTQLLTNFQSSESFKDSLRELSVIFRLLQPLQLPISETR